MEFFDWNMLSELAGSSLAVAVLTQLTKALPLVRSLPTQLYSYILALATLLLAQAFGGGLDPSGAVLAVFNAALVSLTANGGYAAVARIREGLRADAPLS